MTRAPAEAVVFAAAEQAKRDTLARLVGRGCPLDLLMDDIRAELSGRPYELVNVGGDYALGTRVRYADAIRAAFVIDPEVRGLSKLEAGVLAAIAYEQPITRADLSERFGREIGRDLIASLRDKALIAPGGRGAKTRCALRLLHDSEISGDVWVGVAWRSAQSRSLAGRRSGLWLAAAIRIPFQTGPTAALKRGRSRPCLPFRPAKNPAALTTIAVASARPMG